MALTKRLVTAPNRAFGADCKLGFGGGGPTVLFGVIRAPDSDRAEAHEPPAVA